MLPYLLKVTKALNKKNKFTHHETAASANQRSKTIRCHSDLKRQQPYAVVQTFTHLKCKAARQYSTFIIAILH